MGSACRRRRPRLLVWIESILPLDFDLGGVARAALSIESLIVGFALGTYKLPLVLAARVIVTVSVAISLVGFELGTRLGRTTERWSEEIGGAVPIIVGIAIDRAALPRLTNRCSRVVRAAACRVRRNRLHRVDAGRVPGAVQRMRAVRDA
jgi:hypothetical protein